MKSRIARKLIIYTILFSSTITLMITMIQLYNEYQFDVNGINQKLEQIKTGYLKSITQSVWLSDQNQLKIILNGITDLPDIIYASVKQENNEVIKSGSIPRGESIEYNLDLKHTYNNKSIEIGQFTVIASLSGVYKRLLNRLGIILLSNALKTSLVAIFIYYLFSRLVTRHLTKISDYALYDSSEILSEPLSLDRGPHKEDEFDIVVKSINEQRKRLSDFIEEVIQQKEYLSQTLNSIGDAVIATDAAGQITRMNPVAERLTGWVCEEARGESVKTVFAIVDASTGKTIENPVEKVLATGNTVYLSNHTQLLAKDGSKYHIADSAAAIRDRDRILGMVLVFNDVTEQYNLREAATKSRRDLQAIMDNLPAILYVKDLEGHYRFINHQYEEQFNILRENIIGKTVYDIFPQPEADELQKMDEAVLAVGHEIESEETAHKDDGIHIYRVIKFPLFDETNKAYAICGISTDITGSRQQEEQLRRSQKMDALGKLTGGIAHDYNNMLGVLLGYSELLTDKLVEHPKLANYAREIHHTAERGIKLTKRLLSFSRHTAPDAVILDINKLLLEQRLMLDGIMTARIRQVFELENDLWPVKLDSSDLEDAIINISINARHAMKEGGELTFQTSNTRLGESDAQLLHIAHGDYVLLSISDTGCGMDNTTREIIFEPFFTTKGELGTGLGLSQVYGFVERSGGAIRVYSEPGQGSRFELYFPKSSQALTQRKAANIETTDQLRGDETILVVDDEPLMTELAHEILSAHGYQILTAGDAEQALLILQTEHVDLVISDVIMPVMDGYQLAAEILKLYPDIKIQMISGYAEERHNIMETDQLHRNIVHKPYTARTLLVNVRNLLDSSPENGMSDVQLEHSTIMVMDDDEDVLKLFNIGLKALGCKTVLVSNGRDAIEQYRNAMQNGEPIDIVILDLSIPGEMNGIEVADKLRSMDSDVRLIVASGYAEGPEMTNFMDYGFQAAIEKTFNRKEIKQVLEKVILM